MTIAQGRTSIYDGIKVKNIYTCKNYKLRSEKITVNGPRIWNAFDSYEH